MSNDSLLEAIEKQISDMEGNLQKEMKKPTSGLIIHDIKEILKFLREKRIEILKRKNSYELHTN